MLSLVKLCIWLVCTWFRTNPEGPFEDLRVWLLCCYLVCLALVREWSLSRVSLPRGTGRVCEGLASLAIRVRECLAIFTTFVLAKGESQKQEATHLQRSLCWSGGRFCDIRESKPEFGFVILETFLSKIVGVFLIFFLFEFLKILGGDFKEISRGELFG